MATVTNASTRNALGVQIIHGKHGIFDSLVLQPGASHTLAIIPNSPIDNGPPDSGIGSYSFYRTNTGPSENPLFWSGTLRFRHKVNVHPDPDINTPPVTIAPAQLQPSDLDKFKMHFRQDPTSDPAIQSLTLNDLAAHAVSRDLRGNWAQPLPNPRQARNIVPPCASAVGVFILDCFLVGWGAGGLRFKISPGSIEDVALAIEPHLSDLEEYVKLISDPSTTWFPRARAVWNTLLLIKNGLMFEAVYHAMIKDLTWWDMVLYGVLGLAELTAAFLTDGAALIAEMVVELASAGFMITDGVKAVETCVWGST